MGKGERRRIFVFPDADALATAAAERVIARIAANAGRVAVGLTGGSSPKKLYQRLRSLPYKNQIPWHRVHWFIGDERFVPADDPLNNMRMARETFIDRYSFEANVAPDRNGCGEPRRSRQPLRGRTEGVLRRRRTLNPPGHYSTSC